MRIAPHLQHPQIQNTTPNRPRLRIARDPQTPSDDLDDRLQGIEEEAEDEHAGVQQEDRVPDPAFGALAHAETGYESDAEEDGDEAHGGEEGVVGVHACLVLEGPETVEGQDEDDFADGEDDDLADAAGLHGAEGDGAHEGDEDGDEGEGGGGVAVGAGFGGEDGA
ncbi:hypothetical protein LTR33_017899 [Friedmanniomyces endolithicus]|nr:hypothetical protein LTR33_017899 [Friedmanniomyces endolithicus]